MLPSKIADKYVKIESMTLKLYVILWSKINHNALYIEGFHFKKSVCF